MRKRAVTNRHALPALLVVAACGSSSGGDGGSAGSGPIMVIRTFPDATHFMKPTDAIELQFSAPLDAGAIHAGSDCVHVESNGASVAISVSVTGGDTIRIVPSAPIAYDTTFNVMPEGRCVRGAHGGPLTDLRLFTMSVLGWIPIVPNPFQEEVTYEHKIGCSIPILGMTPDGRSVIACAQGLETMNARVVVRREKNGDWETLGTIDPVTTLQDPYAMAITSTGDPILAYASAAVLYVSRFDGSAWQAMGAPSGLKSTFSAGGGMVLGADDKPYVAWGDGTGANCYVGHWNGTSWDALGGSLHTGTETANAPAIALAPDGQPIVAYRSASNTAIVAKKWDGAAWQPLGATVGPIGGQSDPPTIVIDASGAPIVAYEREPQFAAYRYANGAWTALGAPFPAGGNAFGKLVRGGDTPIVAVQASAGFLLNEWNGSAWVAHGPPPGFFAGFGGMQDYGEIAFAAPPTGRARGVRVQSKMHPYNENNPGDKDYNEIVSVARPNE